MKAGNRGPWFLGVGLLVGWVGTSSPALALEADDVPAPSLAGCEVVPVVQPEALAAWKDAAWATSTYGYCNESAADGAGNIIMTQFPENMMRMSFRVLRPDGSYLWDGGISEVNAMVLNGQPRGFLGRSAHPLTDLTWLTFLDNTDRRVAVHAEPSNGMPWSAVNPSGGLHELGEGGILRAYSDVGQLRWSAPLAHLLSGPPSLVGVNTEGHTLVLSITQLPSGAAEVEGVWMDSSGQPGASFFALTLPNPPQYARYDLVPLVQGGLLLSVENYLGKSWVASFGSLQTSSGPVPGWLSNGDVSPFALLPGGRGYVRWRKVNEDPSGCQFEARLTAPSGESCGTVRLPSTGAGDSCFIVSLGGDGTVLESLPSIYVSGGRPYSLCRARWWPALFQ